LKILVVGDVHWSEYSSIIRKRGDKYSKRLENLINSLNWVEDLAEQQRVDKVIFLGDFFDKQTLNAGEISALQEVVWSTIPHDFIVGNHEGLNETLDISSAHIFKFIPNARVIDKPVFDCGFGYQFLYLPYCKEEDRKSIKYWKDYFTSGYWTTQEVKHTIVFSHNDVKIQYGLMPATIGYDIEDIDTNCTYFLNGHLHNSGKFSSKGYNIGNLTGQNFVKMQPSIPIV
jgi:DNA repair exonuclease SbcCD nuclease subunit